MKDESDNELKIPKKEIPSPASSSSSPDSPPIDQSPLKIEKIEDEFVSTWCGLEDGGAIKDLLPAGVIKNSSKLRFDVKEINLSED